MVTPKLAPAAEGESATAAMMVTEMSSDRTIGRTAISVGAMNATAVRVSLAELVPIVSRFGVSLDATQLKALERYAFLLRDWNERVNLTAIVETTEIATKHFLDSLTGLAVRRWRVADVVIDVGSGAGFPGVPIAIAVAGARVTLVESVGKKVEFLRALIAELGLERVRVVQARAEELAHAPEHRERYDVATLRALPNLALNLELLLPFLRPGGEALVYKGRVEHELAAAQRAVKALSGEIAEIATTASLGLGAPLPGRCVVVARKRGRTPARYPRRAAEMQRRPW